MVNSFKNVITYMLTKEKNTEKNTEKNQNVVKCDMTKSTAKYHKDLKISYKSYIIINIFTLPRSRPRVRAPSIALTEQKDNGFRKSDSRYFLIAV